MRNYILGVLSTITISLVFVCYIGIYDDNKKIKSDTLIKIKKSGNILEFNEDTKIETTDTLVNIYTTTDDYDKNPRVYKKYVGFNKKDVEVI